MSGLLLTQVVPGLTGIFVPIGSNGQVLKMNGSVAEFGDGPTGGLTGLGGEVLTLNSSGTDFDTNSSICISASTNPNSAVLTGDSTTILSTKITSRINISGTRNMVVSVVDSCDSGGTNTIGMAYNKTTSGGQPIIDGTNFSIIASDHQYNSVVSNTGKESMMLCMLIYSSGGRTSMLGTRGFMTCCQWGGTFTSSSENSARLACTWFANMTHKNSIVACSHARTSIADNTLEATNFTVGGSPATVSDKTMKDYVEDNGLEDKDDLFTRFNKVKCKKYRLKGDGQERCGFDADEMKSQFPEAVVDGRIKSIDIMAVTQILWAVCKRKQMEINKLKQLVGL